MISYLSFESCYLHEYDSLNRPCLAPTQRLEMLQKRADNSKISMEQRLDMVNQVRIILLTDIPLLD